MVSDNEFGSELIALLVLVGVKLASVNAVNDGDVPALAPDRLAICPGLKPPIWLAPVRKLKLLLCEIFDDEDVDTDVVAAGVTLEIAATVVEVKFTFGLESTADLVIAAVVALKPGLTDC